MATRKAKHGQKTVVEPIADTFDISNVKTVTATGRASAFKPSSQQTEIYSWIRGGRGNLMIRAVAGAGKTTTLIEGCTMMSGSIALAAYNKAIAMEFGEKLQARGSHAFSGTFHSFGFRAWKRIAPNARTDRDKIWNLMGEHNVPHHLKGFVQKTVSLAKQRAIGVLCPFNDNAAWQYIVDHYDLEDMLSSEPLKATALEERVGEGLHIARMILMQSVERDADIIDFDDMIYAPLAHDAKVWQNDWVLVDEAQDTNPARRALAKKMLKPGGRAIFVGDENQAIYGFTGADNDSMDIIRREFGCTDLPLTITYRCPKAVVKHAQQWVNHIEAGDTAPEGSVTQMKRDVFDKLEVSELDVDSAVLCRYTKPLVETAFKLIKRRIPCHVEGRDIGNSLIQLTKRWKTSSIKTLRDKLDKYKERETQKYMAKGQEQKAESISDRVETLIVIMDSLVPPNDSVECLRLSISSLFGDTPEGERPRNLTLSTVHRSKGREWNRVYLLGRQSYMPSKFARQDWQVQQEINLIYVAVTRAKNILVEVAAK